MRLLAPTLMLALLLGGCSHDPIRYIPQTDRAMLQTQERLGDGQSAAGPITVEEMLRRAKASEPAKAASEKVVIRFNGEAVQPDAAQRDQLQRFAISLPNKTVPVVVSSRPGSFDDAGAAVLGQRRALAVSRTLSGLLPDITVRFEEMLPPDIVVVSLDSQKRADTP